MAEVNQSKPQIEQNQTFLDTVEGITPLIKAKLYGYGFESPESIALSIMAYLTEVPGVSEELARNLLTQARAHFEWTLKSGTTIATPDTPRALLPTGSSKFDQLLSGGLESGSLIEVTGGSGSGKTQLVHQLAVNCVKDWDRDVIWIDTSKSFRFKRITQIAKVLDLDPTKVLDRITVGRAYNSELQTALTTVALQTVKNIGMIIIDTLANHIWIEHPGRGGYPDRTYFISKYLADLAKQAELRDCVAVITNQVTVDPDNFSFFGDPLRPVDENLVGHYVTARIRLYKGKNEKRKAYLTLHPELPDGKCEFAITREGVRDLSR